MEILYRDDRIVAVAKPSGLAVHRSDRVRDPVVVMTLARDAVGRRVLPVHRLDRGTSGVLLFALDPEAARFLQEQLTGGSAAKVYLALVRGIPPESGTIDHPVPRERKSSQRLPAVTDFRRLGVGEGRYSLVEARPRTGRHHQIRRHLKHLSCPLIGDVTYGKGEHNRFFRERFGFRRLALHALEVEIAHPDGGVLHLRAEVPPDLGAVLAGLGLLAAVPGAADRR